MVWVKLFALLGLLVFLVCAFIQFWSIPVWNWVVFKIGITGFMIALILIRAEAVWGKH